MRKRDKEKYIKLALQSSEKGVPEGHYYVGKGKAGGLPFTKKSMMAKRPSFHTHWGVSGSNGIYDDCEYTTSVDDWEAVVGQKLEPAKEAEPKFYYNSEKNNRFFTRYGGTAQVVSLVGEECRYHYLFEEGEGVVSTKSIKDGIWVEVNPADWPEITNSFILKHAKNLKQNTMKDRLLKSAIRVKSTDEFFTLRGLYIACELNKKSEMKDEYKNEVEYFWQFREYVTGWTKNNSRDKGKILYNSLQDFLEDKPIKETEIKLNTQYTAVINEQGIKVGCVDVSVGKMKEIIAALKEAGAEI